MSRYSPTVRPYEGPDMGQMLAQAFITHRQLKRQKALEERQDQQFANEQEEHQYRVSQRAEDEKRRTQQDAVQSAELHDQGFRTLDEADRVAQAPAPVTGALVRDLKGNALEPIDPRYEKHGALLRDPDATPLAREMRKQQQVFSQVQQADPDDYPAFVPGLDYTKELGTVLQANRTRERDEAQAQERFNQTKYVQTQENQRAAANRNAINQRADADRKLRSPRQLPADPRQKELREGLIAKHGRPASQLQQDVLDALEEGETRESIVEGMRRAGVPAPLINQALDYLSPPTDDFAL